MPWAVLRSPMRPVPPALTMSRVRQVVAAEILVPFASPTDAQRSVNAPG